MAKTGISTKRLQINQANSRIIFSTAVAAFLVVFALVSSRALLDQRAYQQRVIDEKAKANRQLDENIRAVEELKKSYAVFVSPETNLIGGDKGGQGDRDGDNAKIVLDALPSKYDYPAVASSLEKVIADNPSYKLQSVSGKDDEVNQNKEGVAPETVEMPFNVAVGTSFQGAKELLQLFEKSIRPISVDTLTIAGSEDILTMTISAKTYYQPERSLDITTKVVE
ncbi:hypothetical protein CR970_01645 [Candidatus Saccharibacteria bacterium]|nr:MAG: hypothetical protein CR970_01645 [Candidatus Saccharibacteria bacterium]